ncbi:hypothetical protein [Treponema pedis]|uniref:hypothetical protein n=1 Tax=Treponema pedis TaxID=409322 RepID=UPI00040460C6|nr:hypothetical protein [Treponema pedis]
MKGEYLVLELITNNIQAIILTLASVVSLISALKKEIIGSSDRINRGKYKAFKLLKEEYIANTHNGYFAFQNYLNQRIEPKLIDFIMTSPDAYSIMKRLKAAEGKYTFDGKMFKTYLLKRQYVLPVTGYSLSSSVIICYLSMNNKLISLIQLKVFLFLLVIILCVFGPILINSLQSISSISSARYLEKITQGEIVKKRKNKQDNKKQLKTDKC